MKRVKLIFLACLVIVLATSMTAQVKLGVRGGATLANYNKDPLPQLLTNQDMTFMTGYDAAVFANFGVTKAFSIQPEIHYIQKGLKITGNDASGDMDVSVTYKFNYLEVPVLARMNFTNANENVIFNIFAGPSAGYALDGKFIGKNFSGENGAVTGDFEEEITWDESYDNDGVKDNRWDLSAVAGFGVEYVVGPVNLLFDARYNYDFFDAVLFEQDIPADHEKFYNRGMSFTLGVAVPLGNK